MFYLYLILFVILFLLIPIPIKLNINYSNHNYNLYIYNFKLNAEKLLNHYKKKTIIKPLKEEDFDLKSMLHLVNYISSLKYKPTIRLKFYFNYGFVDASNTAIAYGYIYSMSPILYKILNIPFKIKRYDYNIKPNFEGPFLESNINSIIFVNLIKIIYMFIFIRYKIKHLKL